MIHNLYVIDAGVCLYSYDFKKTTIDDQLLGGFLTAIGLFAQETFKKGLQSIGIHGGQKLIFYIETTQKLTFCAIANDLDNNFLLEKILKEIAEKFVNELKDILNSSDRAAVSEYNRFDSMLLEIVKNKDKIRNKKSMAMGLTVGIIMFLAITTITSFINQGLREILSFEAFFYYFLILLCVSIAFTSFISGFQAGNPKYGVLSGIVFFIVITFLIALTDYQVFLGFLLIAPFAGLTYVAAGYFGGLICDRRKLYPLVK